MDFPSGQSCALDVPFSSQPGSPPSSPGHTIPRNALQKAFMLLERPWGERKKLVPSLPLAQTLQIQKHRGRITLPQGWTSLCHRIYKHTQTVELSNFHEHPPSWLYSPFLNLGFTSLLSASCRGRAAFPDSWEAFPCPWLRAGGAVAAPCQREVKRGYCCLEYPLIPKWVKGGRGGFHGAQLF